MHAFGQFGTAKSGMRRHNDTRALGEFHNRGGRRFDAVFGVEKK